MFDLHVGPELYFFFLYNLQLGARVVFSFFCIHIIDNSGSDLYSFLYMYKSGPSCIKAPLYLN